MDTTQPIQASVPAAPAPLKIGKFKASRQIVKESWGLLKQDKEIVWFPVISTIVSLFALAILGVIYFYAAFKGNINNIQNANGIVGYIFLFLYYLVLFFIINFFQAGILIIAAARLNNQDLTFGDGIAGASRNAGKIFRWSLIAATVGLILQIIADKFKLIGQIVATVLGAAWNILTFFSLPSLIIGQHSVRDSFKDSASIIRKTWGETIIVSLGVGLFFALLVFLGFAVTLTLIILFPHVPVVATAITLFFIYLVVLAMISSALNVIFKLALYEYAKSGVVPGRFSPELIQNAIKSK
jgi:hypothetical protein